MAAGKEFKVAFPFVAKRVVVAISGGDGPMRISFRSQTAATDLNVKVAHHYFELDGDEESMTFQVKCKEIFIKNVHGSTAAGFQLYAELTSIPTGNMYVMTGSGLSGGPAGGSGQTN